MSVLVKIMLVIHIAAGFTALLVGIIPMIAKKGGRVHNRAGNIFYWCMAVVCLTALYLVFFKPSSLFLLFIAIFSFYMCFTGRRVLRLKKAVNQPTALDHWAAYLALGAALIMFGLGVQNVIKIFTTGSIAVFGLLYFFFAGILFSHARYDIVHFRNPDKRRHGNMEWFFGHITRMVGSYIATITAFATVNTRYLPIENLWVDIAAWTLPGIVGGMLIGRWIAYYKKKFEQKNEKTSSQAKSVLA
ncbi:DUF2306 domain-containing protein [Tellurirhabdus bombi]|uniref:DUF2306 domain-containing protein n=1 Tax=Tellurirhabdus bombi TaxID=2907205 RepID=UPI001F1FF5D8|nr:DUF2306 domain-containing protein [Tellurirhabdus bombi]